MPPPLFMSQRAIKLRLQQFPTSFYENHMNTTSAKCPDISGGFRMYSKEALMGWNFTADILKSIHVQALPFLKHKEVKSCMMITLKKLEIRHNMAHAM